MAKTRSGKQTKSDLAGVPAAVLREELRRREERASAER